MVGWEVTFIYFYRLIVLFTYYIILLWFALTQLCSIAWYFMILYLIPSLVVHIWKLTDFLFESFQKHSKGMIVWTNWLYLIMVALLCCSAVKLLGFLFHESCVGCFEAVRSALQHIESIDNSYPALDFKAKSATHLFKEAMLFGCLSVCLFVSLVWLCLVWLCLVWFGLVVCLFVGWFSMFSSN